MRSTRNIVDPLSHEIDRQVFKTLPTMIEDYARKPGHRVSEEFLKYLSWWHKTLEYSHYKKPQSSSHVSRRMDRILLFLEAVRQQPEKDGAWMMNVWRRRFSLLEMYLQLQAWNISVADDRTLILGKLCHPDLKAVKMIRYIHSRCEKKGLKICDLNVFNEWVEYRKEINEGKAPGKIAIENFNEQYLRYWMVLKERTNIDKVDVHANGHKRQTM